MANTRFYGADSLTSTTGGSFSQVDVTTSIAGIVPTANGGTNANNTPTSGKVLIGNGSAFVTSSAGVPTSVGSTGTILRSDGTNWAASTPTYPNAASTAGKVVVSDGTNLIMSTPTFPNASATSGKIIKSDGTNWQASTETYAAPGTSGNVLTSDGTNWTSAAAGSGVSGLTYVTLNITSAQIKALHGTPITVVSAPAAGKVLCLVGPVYAKFNYGGSNVFVAGASQTIELYYGTTQSAMASANTVISNAVLVGTSSQYKTGAITSVAAASASWEALALTLYNPVATEITGNAGNNNTITVSFLYYTVTLT